MTLQEKYDGAVRVIAEAVKDITDAEATIARQAEVIAKCKEAMRAVKVIVEINGDGPKDQAALDKLCAALAEGR